MVENGDAGRSTDDGEEELGQRCTEVPVQQWLGKMEATGLREARAHGGELFIAFACVAQTPSGGAGAGVMSEVDMIAARTRAQELESSGWASVGTG